MVSKRHRHRFHALWSHFGPHGRQDVHFHPCIVEERHDGLDCDRVLIGKGRDCDGKTETHHRETL
jgi:hypothetical protein